MTTSVVATARPPKNRLRGGTAAPHKPGEKPFGTGRIVSFIALVVLAVFWLLPFAWAVSTSLRSETDAASAATWIPAGGFTFDAFARVEVTDVVTRGNKKCQNYNLTNRQF